ncbi:hypothetical protein K493DRAFT_302319 [Basidiobolus meristosporus CBS 931.73]|uniref:Carbohydrate-binding domain-containing protein n=1 Tax=Basidiobolus meristosporus CBS 931.73 TaxID=1314790 RepID=A0A1Y1Y7L0_9FUNG|nr:hypothetical protein K493DRAFT_302319 [Basidiobolus meristosporus CBS 931.73]|eukprot:ORX94000.1 hypothetical protein K493DRAFT_302319 [Basidiobolus meristosporus CBS 931.73]
MKISKLFKNPLLLPLFIQLGNNLISYACECPLPTPKTYTSYRRSGTIEIDGKLDEEAWDRAPWTETFGNVFGEDEQFPRPPENIETKVKLIWDDQYLYVGALLLDPVIRALENEAVLGEVFDDNTFQLYLDHDRTNHNYKVIQMNPNGVYKSSIYNKPPSDDGYESWWDLGPDFEFKIYTHGEVNNKDWKPVEDGYWSVEMKIPLDRLSARVFDSLGIKKRAEETSAMPTYMGLNFLRTGFPPKGVVNIQAQSTTVQSTVSSFFLFGLGNFNTLLKRHEVGPKYQTSWSPLHSNDIHHPELWGQVMFRNTTNTYKPFVPDQSYPTRFALMQIYYGEKAYAATHDGVYTENYQDLDIDVQLVEDCIGPLKIRTSDDGVSYEASIRYRKQTGHIREDRYLHFTDNH